MSEVRMSFAPQLLSTWTIYWDPLDAPGLYVLRRFDITREGPHATSEAYMHKDVEVLRRQMRMRSLYCIGRDVNDEPQIVETWL